MLSGLRRKRNLQAYAGALEKLNRRFAGLANLLKTPLRVESVERDYSRLVKAALYCQLKVRKAYGVDFIPRLQAKLQNRVFSTRQHLATAFAQELRMLRQHSGRNVTHLFVLVKKCVRVEFVAAELLKEFDQGSGADVFFFRQDADLLRNTLAHVKKLQPALVDPETEDYVLGIKRKVQARAT